MLERCPESGAPIISRRQKLPPEAFLQPATAAQLFASGTRSVLVLSHCWQTALHPDPHGTTLREVRRYLAATLTGAGGFGLFWGE